MLQSERQFEDSAAPHNYLMRSIIFQLFGYVLGMIISKTLKFDSALQHYLPLLTHALSAGLFARLSKLPKVWQIFNLLLMPSVYLSAYINLPYIALTLLAIFAASLYIPTFWTKVPYYPTSRPMYSQVLEQLPNDQTFTFIDLGSGFGDLLKFLADHRPQAKFVGVEISPLAFLISKIKLLLNKNIKIEYRDFWSLNLADYDFVYAFLAPAPMPRLWKKVKSEMRANTYFMTNTFEVGETPIKTIQVKDKHNCKLFLHRM